MDDKKQILAALIKEFNQWEELLSSLPEKLIIKPNLTNGMSIKDVVAHLWAWQTRSTARMEAAIQGTEPDFPRWPAGLEPDSHEDLDQINLWIYETNRDRTWSSVYQDWKSTYSHLLELAEQVPEIDLLEVGKYPWLPEYSLSLILTATHEHHHVDHLDPLVVWLDQNRDVNTAG